MDTGLADTGKLGAMKYLPLVWAALLILIALGVLLFALTARVERLVIPWHVSMRTSRR